MSVRLRPLCDTEVYDQTDDYFAYCSYYNPVVIILIIGLIVMIFFVCREMVLIVHGFPNMISALRVCSYPE